jgi:hypothetical protein
LRLQQVTDSGANSTFATLASFTANDNRVFRGVALSPVAVPEPSTLVLGTMAALEAVAIRRRAKRSV